MTSLPDLIESIWSHFFPKDKYSKQDTRIIPIQAFLDTFKTYDHLWKNQPYYEGYSIFDIKELINFLNFNDFEVSLINRPYEVLGCLGISLSIAIYDFTHPIEDREIPIPGIPSTQPMIPPIYPRLVNLSSMTSFGDLKSSKVGQFISIKGYVVKASAIRPLVQRACFMCNKCMSLQSIYLEDGVFNPPSSCSTAQCRNKFLDLQRNGVNTIPYQQIKLQEMEDNNEDSARVPRTFELEARGDLVNCFRVGEVVTVTGIVKTVQLDIQRVSKSVIKEGGLFQLYLVLNSITHAKATKSDSQTSVITTTATAAAMTTASMISSLSTSQDQNNKLSLYRSISSSSLCLAQLCASMCPTIYGNELVKAGLLLSLLGGTSTSYMQSENTNGSVHLRSDIHVLMVGDPGLGKSQLLRACVSLASRGVLVCGNTSSAAGLSVTIGRDGRDTSIEAGALVLADQGICCIDELDKLSCDYHALLEAMEQQRISIAKSGVVTSFKTRTSILAAANPSSGYYQRKKSLCENLKMPTSLISRFDIVFLLLDRPEIAHDRRISEHIMRTHRLSLDNTILTHHYASHPKDSSIVWNDENELNRTLSQRLRHDCDIITPNQYLPLVLMREYIEYARKSIHPKLSRNAAKVLQKMYLTLRAQASLGQSIPVTTRHLESLIRLAQARAKVELRSDVTESDANDVVELLQESLLDAFTDDKGEVDFGRKGGMGLAKQVKALVKILTREAELKSSKMFTKAELVEIVSRMKIERDFDSLIEILRTECYLLYKGPRLFQLQTA